MDHRIALRNDLEKSTTWKNFEAMDPINSVVKDFLGAGVIKEKDVYCVTYIVNGELAVDDTFDFEDQTYSDYLEIYSTEDGLDFPRLLHDDYFEAIHLLWNNKKYVSCLKLVFSAIDTLGFVEYGPREQHSFKLWLDRYCDLSQLRVTSAELWELRNSLIHMTNLDSHKVVAGKTQRLLPCFTHPEEHVASFVNGMKVFHVARFVMKVLPIGLERWLESYNQDRSKFRTFVKRYDLVVSEARMLSRNARQ